jgi:hypothetical protein
MNTADISARLAKITTSDIFPSRLLGIGGGATWPCYHLALL